MRIKKDSEEVCVGREREKYQSFTGDAGTLCFNFYVSIQSQTLCNTSLYAKLPILLFPR